MFSSRQNNVQGSAGFSYIKFWILVQADVFRPEFKRGTVYQFVRLSGFEEPSLQKSFFFSSIGQKENKIFFLPMYLLVIAYQQVVSYRDNATGISARSLTSYLAQRSSGDNHGTLRRPLWLPRRLLRRRLLHR